MRLINPNNSSQFLTQSTTEACGAVLGGFLYDGQMFISSSSSSIPIYRLEKNGNYLYTASTGERDGSGFSYNGVAFFGVDPSDPNAKPVYRLSNNSGSFLYTISAAERDYFTQREGFHLNGISFYAYENSGNSVSPVYRLSNSTSGFLYTVSSQERDAAVAQSNFTYNGVSFNAITMFNAIDVPIYRLRGPRGYLLTTSLSERLGAYRAGFVNEYAAMYTYGIDNPTTNIYRLSNSAGNFLYTGSTGELNGAIQNAGFKLNGTSFSAPN